MKSRLHQQCYERSCQEIEEIVKTLLYRRNGVTQQRLNIQCSMIRNLEQRVYYWLKFGNYMNDWNLSKIRRSSKILTPSSFGSAHVSHQALILSSTKKHSRESRMQRSTRENMSILGYVVDRQHAQRNSDELHNDSRLAASSGIQRREGIEKSGSQEPLQPMLLPCFSGKAQEKVWSTEIVLSPWLTVPRVSGLVLKVAWKFRVIFSPRCILEKSPTIRNFRAGLWTSEQRFARRKRIPHARCSGSRKSKQQNHWMTSSLQNQ